MLNDYLMGMEKGFSKFLTEWILGKKVINLARLIDPIEDISPENEKIVRDGILKIIHVFLSIGFILGMLLMFFILKFGTQFISIFIGGGK